jgi:feruloyl esterase
MRLGRERQRVGAIASGNSFPARTRPLCRYPAYASYNGTGDPQDAANFACTAPKTR